MPYPVVFAGQPITADLIAGLRLNMATQSDNLTVTNADAESSPQSSEIRIPVEAGAIYWFQTVLTYSATVNSDFGWWWDVPTGTSMPRQTVALIEEAGTGLNTGADTIIRSPAGSTVMRAGGTNSAGEAPDHFHAVHEYGTIQVGGTSGFCQLMWGQFTSHDDETILRGLQRTRVYWRRVQ